MKFFSISTYVKKRNQNGNYGRYHKIIWSAADAIFPLVYYPPAPTSKIQLACSKYQTLTLPIFCKLIGCGINSVSFNERAWKSIHFLFFSHKDAQDKISRKTRRAWPSGLTVKYFILSCNLCTELSFILHFSILFWICLILGTGETWCGRRIFPGIYLKP